MSNSRRLTDADREQRRLADRERLHQAAQQLLTSDGWQRWVRVRARGGLARLSLNNQLLVALSCPEATFVAGFKAWLALGYCVRKGETAIRIVAPMPIKDRDDERQSDEEAQTRLLFKAVSVFDRSQVAPLEGVEPHAA
jgi:N-terminal domain of anti-restriction factor ArdC